MVDMVSATPKRALPAIGQIYLLTCGFADRTRIRQILHGMSTMSTLSTSDLSANRRRSVRHHGQCSG